MIRQRTLKKPVNAVGIGLHSGKKVKLTLRPLPVNSGVIYRRTDLNPPVDFPASATSVKDTMLCTALVNAEGVRISTVEHINAALSAFGLDNIMVEVDAPEIPIMDGSSSSFIFLILEAGIEEQNSLKKFIRIKDKVRVEAEGGKWAEIIPSAGFSLDFEIDFDHPAITSDFNRYKLNFSTKNFITEISRARTFGFLKDIDMLRANGLCLGGSLDSAIVLDDYTVLNPGGLRFKDEFVRHKILDAVGDLYMCGHNILGAYKAYKSGHALNNILLQKVLQTQEAWEYFTIEDEIRNREVAGVFELGKFQLAR